MTVLQKLLSGPEPFKMLQEHLSKSMECVELVQPMLAAAIEGNQEELKKLAHRAFELEHEADLLKNRIRDNLPRETLLPVSRHDFLAFLKEQDSLADKVEDLAMMLTVREFQLPKVCKEHECSHLLLELANYAVESTRLAASVIRKLNDLKDRGFSGELIEEMRGEAKIVGELEWKADKVQYKLLKEVLAIEEPAWTFAQSYSFLGVIRTLGGLANHAEGITDFLRLMIAE